MASVSYGANCFRACSAESLTTENDGSAAAQTDRCGGTVGKFLRKWSFDGV
jgi:hypothetical protein